ncbi:serpin family protein [Prosthecochloris marina]|uniref:Serpin family protein n=1 Tax=Prosthecochloris marina TaxID=2017681 RepID=A0A317T3T8_9CHLB|nr:serpin family protein [Prosthecochloris marina]PWW81382.1 serpin family protein [Prosthecochloris marina]
MSISNILRTILILLLFIPVFACSVPAKTGKVENRLSTAIKKADKTAFSLNLYRTLSKNTESNLFFSPYSISAALSMTIAGAAGETERQIASLLQAPENIATYHTAQAAFEKNIDSITAKGAVTLETANSLWPQEGYVLSNSFLHDLKQYYRSTVTSVDYTKNTETARETINTWVEKKTRDKIKELLKPGILNSLTRLTLVNAIYFKGDWTNSFDKSTTTESSFFVKQDKTVTVSMMHQEQQFKYASTDSLQILELPYSGNDLSMLVLLPVEKNRISMLENSITPELLNTLTNSLKETTVNVFLPKFTLTSTLRLDQTLRTLGMTDAFDPMKADFSNMTPDSDNLFIGAVVHKAFIDVNEEGTEAAAATGVVMQLTSAMPEPAPVFRADHPFVFMIRENRFGTILFMGRVVDPSHH